LTQANHKTLKTAPQPTRHFCSQFPPLDIENGGNVMYADRDGASNFSYLLHNTNFSGMLFHTRLSLAQLRGSARESIRSKRISSLSVRSKGIFLGDAFLDVLVFSFLIFFLLFGRVHVVLGRKGIDFVDNGLAYNVHVGFEIASEPIKKVAVFGQLQIVLFLHFLQPGFHSILVDLLSVYIPNSSFS